MDLSKSLYAIQLFFPFLQLPGGYLEESLSCLVSSYTLYCKKEKLVKQSLYRPKQVHRVPEV
jgi:hypothetical protein